MRHFFCLRKKGIKRGVLPVAVFGMGEDWYAVVYNDGIGAISGGQREGG